MFSWKSEAVLYSDHDRCYLFIPKQARLPPPPLVYLSATLAPLSSLLLFNPALSIRIYISLPLSLSLFLLLLFSRAGRTIFLLAPSFTKLIEIEDTDTVELAYRRLSNNWREGERLNYSRGKRYSDPACRFLRALFRNDLVDGIGLYRDIYRGEERFPCMEGGVFACFVMDWA